MKKRICSIALVAAMIFTMFPSAAFASETVISEEMETEIVTSTEEPTAEVLQTAEPETPAEETESAETDLPETAPFETEDVGIFTEEVMTEEVSVPEMEETVSFDSVEETASAANEADVQAETGREDSSKCGDNLTWSVEMGTLTIAGSGDMYDYSPEVLPPWYSYMEETVEIILGSDVTGIGAYAFSGISVSVVSVPDSITRIGDYAFERSVRLIGSAGSEAEAFADRNGNPFSAMVSQPAITSLSNDYDGVKINWGAVENAQLYCVLRKTSNTQWTELVQTEALSYTDNSVQSGTAYYYTVQCLSEDGAVSTSTYDTVGKSIVYVAPPEISSISAGNDGVTVSWGKVPGAAKYRVYRKTSTSGWSKIADTANLSCVDTAAAVNTTYTYTVRCIDSAGNFISAYDTVGKSITFASKPAISSVSNVYGGVSIVWSKVSGAARYRVYRKTGSGSWTKIADTTAASYTDKAVTSGSKYTYTVRCLNAAGSFNSGFDSAGKTITYVAAPVLSSISNVYGGVTVSWSKTIGAAKYRVYRKSGSGSWAKVADTASTSYTDKTVKAGTKYDYTVRCLDTAGTTISSFNSTGISITYVAAPAISSLSNVVGGVKVSWPKAAGAGMYRVYRKSGSGSWTKVGDTTALTYTDKTVKSGTKYFYTVRCLNAAGTSFVSSFDPTGKSITYVAAPSLGSISNVYGGVSVSWGKVTGAAKYRVYRKSGSGSWAKLADTTAATYTDKTVKNGTQYYYTVRCLDSAGNTVSSFDSAGKAITYVAAPTISSLENVNGGVKISWAKAPTTASYRVYRKTGSGSWTRIGDTTALTYTDKTTTGGTKYTYTIRCMNSAGSFVSSYNNTGKSITYVAPPKISSLTSVKDGVKVNWGKVAGASKYRIYRKIGSGSWVNKGDTAALTFTDKSAVSGTTYTYTVRCLDSAGNIISSFDAAGKTITYSDEAFRPNFSVLMVDSTDADAYGVLFQLTNYGNYTMTIYPDDAYLIDSDTSSFNRRLRLTNSSLQPLDWIMFPSNSRDYVYFEILNPPTWYDKKTTISFKFKYNGDWYRAYCSSYYGTRYTKL